MGFILLFLIPVIAMADVHIISNFPLRKSNLEKVINLENYKEMVEIIKSVEDVKDIYLMEEEDKVIIYIERYPIVRKIHIKGNVALSRDEILSYLGLYDGIPVRGPEFKEADIEQRLKALYTEKGFLDAAIGVVMTKDEEGYIDLYIGINEGPIYFTERGLYKGSSYEPSILDSKIGLVRGRVFKETIFREGVFLIQDFYIKEGFWDSFVYYEGVEKIELKKPFFRVLFPKDEEEGRRPLRFFGSLAEGISNLFSHPIGTLRALTGKGHVARPVFSIIEGKRYHLFWEGNQFFSDEELKRITQLEEKGLDPFSLEEARENLLKAYHRKGFFDAKIDYQRDGEAITFKVEEGERYRVIGELLKGEFYDEEKIEDILKSELDRLYKRGYTLAEGKISKEILKEKKEVRVSLNIEKGKRQILKDFVYNGRNRDIKRIFSKHKEQLPATFNTDLIEAINLDIQRYLLKKGFMEGDFDVEVGIEEDKDSIYYTYIYDIKEGPVYRLGETIYYGYEKTSLRELSYMTEKSKNYSEDLKEKTLHNMLNSEIFSGVSIDTFLDKEKKIVHRLVQVSEDKRGILDFSLGYNTEERFSIEGFLGLKNLFGIGLSSGFRYKRTGNRELYDLSFFDGFLFSRKYWLKSNLFKGYEEHKGYNLYSKGFNIQLGYRITINASVGPVLGFSDNSVGGHSFYIRKYGLFLIREFKDDIFSPRRIHYNSLSLSFAEGSRRYKKFDLSTFYLIPLIRESNLSFKVSGGAVSKEAPIFEKFFLGGLKDLRGYSFEEIGQPSGGRYYAFGRLEFSFTVRKPFVVIAFGDVGNVADKPGDLLNKVKSSLGLGLGVSTPIGPVRVDIAFPVEEDWLKRYKVYLSVGYYY